jgi:FixJ family two-component response regulator
MELINDLSASAVAVMNPPETRTEENTDSRETSVAGEPIVHIVDDDPEVCRSLKYVIQTAGFRVATYTSARDFLASNAAAKPGCLILDIRLPGTNGLELQERLAALGSSIPVIIISGYADVSLAVRAMRKGAMDLLEKPFDSSLLLDRIRQGIEIDRKIHIRRGAKEQIQSRISTLTPREREVMRLVVQGNANKRIAATLGISMKTVEAHRAHVMRKMQADSLAELVQMVQQVQGDPPPPGLGRHFVN